MNDIDKPGVFERAEAAAGVVLIAIFACAWIGGILFLLALMNQRTDLHADPSMLLAIGVPLCLGELCSAIFLARAVSTAKSPILLNVLRRQFRISRAVQATLWIWHFICMTVAPEAIVEELRRRGIMLSHSVFAIVLMFVVTVAASVAANIFLLLGIDTAYPNDPIVARLYSNRFVIDVVAAAVVLSLPSENLMIFRVPFVFLFRVVLPH